MGLKAGQFSYFGILGWCGISLSRFRLRGQLQYRTALSGGLNVYVEGNIAVLQTFQQDIMSKLPAEGRLSPKKNRNLLELR